ncbi:OmpA family protein [uncultured Litoreibacter sp.]|uniref:OmpA family protein n=1 Tax=uncultured Litoreibacter sp. TaxID=1392394 RepID=UPI00261E6BC8|nr:OmpA family protein [uncultured Litoreibacter sp.]
MTIGLSACGGDFYREAGATVDEGGFGNPTMTNSLISTGQLAVAEGLARRFENEVPPSVNFAFNSAKLDAASRQILLRQANWIRQFPEVRFRVYGHTDLVGSNSYNKSLGLRRANAVVRFLSTQGISRSRLEAVVSFGETQPLVVTEGRERRNRRTVTEVSGFVDGHPSLLDGKYAAIIYREHLESAGRSVFDEVSAGVTQ